MSFRVLVLLSLCTLVWLSPAASATPLDEGDVEALLDGSLAIGTTSFGRRTVDAEADGPYTETRIGFLRDVSGELVLQNGASFETTGALRAGGGGGASIDVLSGSTLLSGSAALDRTSGGDFTQHHVRVLVDGDGSQWLNAGLLEAGLFTRQLVNVTASGGGLIRTNGAILDGTSYDGQAVNVLITGPGSTWENRGDLAIRSRSGLTVRDGAHASDGDVDVLAVFAPSPIVIEGEGSTWSTGAMNFRTYGYGGTLSLLIADGGSVHSTSVRLATDYFQEARVQGAGSSWRIDEGLNVLSWDGGSLLSVLAGATVTADETYIGGTFSGGAGQVTVSGPGSTLETEGTLRLQSSSIVRATLDVLDGAAAVTQDFEGLCTSTPYSWAGCELHVMGAGSMLRISGEGRFDGDGVAGDTGLWTVADGGRVEAAGVLEISDAAELRLDGGSVSAQRLLLNGGVLSGEGQVEGTLENRGSLEPGASAGRLVIDGDFEQGSDGVLEIKLGGTAPGEEHDLLEVLGTSLLAGTLVVSLIDGFVPAYGDVFHVIESASLSGEFDEVVGFDLGEGMHLEFEYGPGGVWLLAIPEPTTLPSTLLGLLALAARARARRILG
jgi:T5SS/PEP-CTERM-associated repeat protein